MIVTDAEDLVLSGCPSSSITANAAFLVNLAENFFFFIYLVIYSPFDNDGVGDNADPLSDPDPVIQA